MLKKMKIKNINSLVILMYVKPKQMIEWPKAYTNVAMVTVWLWSSVLIGNIRFFYFIVLLLLLSMIKIGISIKKQLILHVLRSQRIQKKDNSAN